MAAGVWGGGGRKQVNKALHTCTSWYAYAAMFGSSIDTMVPRALKRMYRLHRCLPSHPFSGRVLSAKTSSLHVTVLRVEVHRRLDRLAVRWLSIGQPVVSSYSTLGEGVSSVCVC